MNMQVINLDLFPFIHLFIWSIKKIFLEEISSSHYLKDEFITEFSYFSKSLKKKKKTRLRNCMYLYLCSVAPQMLLQEAQKQRRYMQSGPIS